MTPRETVNERDEVFNRILKMPPQPHVSKLRAKTPNAIKPAKKAIRQRAAMAGVIQIRGSLKTETRLGTSIANYFDRTPLLAGKIAECASWRAKHPHADHSRGAASASYNCHGLTFASRRTGVDDPQVVRAILSEDDYIKIDRKDLLVGDTVIYVDQDGDITHSGIVVGVPPLGAKILSKWGECQEVIHDIGDCPYINTSKEFYRICK